MKNLLVSSLTLAIAATLSTALGQATTTTADHTTFEKSELSASTYTYRRYNSGTGRREILS